LFLDEVIHAQLSLTKSAMKPTSRSRKILTTSYASASIGALEKNTVQLQLRKTLTHILIL